MGGLENHHFAKLSVIIDFNKNHQCLLLIKTSGWKVIWEWEDSCNFKLSPCRWFYSEEKLSLYSGKVYRATPFSSSLEKAVVAQLNITRPTPKGLQWAGYRVTCAVALTQMFNLGQPECLSRWDSTTRPDSSKVNIKKKSGGASLVAQWWRTACQCQRCWFDPCLRRSHMSQSS